MSKNYKITKIIEVTLPNGEKFDDIKPITYDEITKEIFIKEDNFEKKEEP